MKNSLKKILVTMLSLMMVIALAACGGGSGSSDSGDSEGGGKLAAIQDAGKIVVATDAAWAPFEYIGEGGQPTGIDIEIAQYIADQLGVELEVQNISFDTIPAALTGGSADLGLACITITEERKEEMAFSDPYTTVQQYIVVGSDSDVATMDDLAGAMIGTHLGTTGDFLVSDEISDGVLKDTGAQNNQYKALPDAAEEVKSGTLQAIVCDSVLAENLVTANNGALKCFPLSYADGSEGDIEEIGAAMAKGDDEFTAKINEIIQSLVESGQIDEWFVQHSEAASKL